MRLAEIADAMDDRKLAALYYSDALILHAIANHKEMVEKCNLSKQSDDYEKLVRDLGY